MMLNASPVGGNLLCQMQSSGFGQVGKKGCGIKSFVKDSINHIPKHRHKLSGADFWMVNRLQSQRLSLAMENNGQCVCWFVISADAALYKLKSAREELILLSLSKTRLLCVWKGAVPKSQTSHSILWPIVPSRWQTSVLKTKKRKPLCNGWGKSRSQNLGGKKNQLGDIDLDRSDDIYIMEVNLQFVIS